MLDLTFLYEATKKVKKKKNKMLFIPCFALKRPIKLVSLSCHVRVSEWIHTTI